jgi:hypothetical protein
MHNMTINCCWTSNASHLTKNYDKHCLIHTKPGRKRPNVMICPRKEDGQTGGGGDVEALEESSILNTNCHFCEDTRAGWVPEYCTPRMYAEHGSSEKVGAHQFRSNFTVALRGCRGGISPPPGLQAASSSVARRTAVSSNQK